MGADQYIWRKKRLPTRRWGWDREKTTTQSHLLKTQLLTSFRKENLESDDATHSEFCEVYVKSILCCIFFYPHQSQVPLVTVFLVNWKATTCNWTIIRLACPHSQAGIVASYHRLLKISTKSSDKRKILSRYLTINRWGSRSAQNWCVFLLRRPHCLDGS